MAKGACRAWRVTRRRRSTSCGRTRSGRTRSGRTSRRRLQLRPRKVSVDQLRPDQDRPDQDRPDQDRPSQSVPFQPSPDHSVPRQVPPPGGARGGRLGPRGGVPGGAEDVLLAGELGPVLVVDHRAAATGQVEGAEPGRGQEGLCVAGEVALLEDLDRPLGVDLARALHRARVVEQPVGAGRQDALDLVRGELGVALKQQRDGAGDDGGGCRCRSSSTGRPAGPPGGGCRGGHWTRQR